MVEPEERERKLPMSIRLSPDGRQILDALAREKGISRTAIIELALREYQERQAKLRYVPLREL
jgi:predicted transcriptional regulator